MAPKQISNQSTQVVAPQIAARKLKIVRKLKEGRTREEDDLSRKESAVSVYSLREHMTLGGSADERYNNAEVFDCSEAKVIRTATGRLESGLLQAIRLAYSGHHHLHLRPDDIWLAIAQGVSAHLQFEDNAEKYRNVFVDHEGKNKISVSVDSFKTGNGSLLNWPECIQLITNQLEERVKGGASKLLQNDFSTTDLTSKCASQIVLMDIMKHYFEYGFHLSCGIPSVTLHGTSDDWERLLEKARALDALDIGLDWWLETLVPVLEKLLETYKGHVDEDWWSRVMNKYERYGSGGGPGTTIYSGWICAFFPYKILGDVVRRNGNEIKDEEVPKGLSECPFKINDNGRELDNVLVAGSCAVCVTEDGLGVQPCIGWLVKKSSGGTPSAKGKLKI
ncbi:hypothetical protein KFL_000320280 [Klebsormidium nitens]|uniref:DUF4419 domain-containing protein n=1 Tax=Klebsormidium nitens TaxID=105231 RepID=A0A1Y1HQR4_KLENI|nr:hypothetical protein KFL_000320280 [Klebsormidium nitens]|eukprot:GAQ79529.1 hypothetical protein KFL_000320280 [Klebsormidium nitens]